MPFNIPYASLAKYSPKGKSEIAKRSRDLCYAIKNGDRQVISQVLTTYVNEVKTIEDPFLAKDVTFIPVPRSSPIKKGDLWPGHIICEELRKKGYGKNISTCLVRVYAVPKSSFSSPGDRPTLKMHYESLRVNPEVIKPQVITIVDDIITLGTTSAACWMRLHEAYPNAEIRIFAFVRTKGYETIDSYIDPYIGYIRVDTDNFTAQRSD